MWQQEMRHFLRIHCIQRPFLTEVEGDSYMKRKEKDSISKYIHPDGTHKKINVTSSGKDQLLTIMSPNETKTFIRISELKRPHT